MWKRTVEKSQTMQAMSSWVILWCQFWKACENAPWRKVKQMHPVWFCILSGGRFEDTFENTQWRKIKQMQSVRLCMLSGRPDDEAFESTHWKEAKQMKFIFLHIRNMHFYGHNLLKGISETEKWIKQTSKQINKLISVEFPPIPPISNE